jgi:hypothetical protein
VIRRENGRVDGENRGRWHPSEWRNPSDLTDEEGTRSDDSTCQNWRQQAPVNIREVVNGIMYI